jgi:hypothetical protein
MPRFPVNCIVKRGGHYNPHERIEFIGQQAGWMLSENLAIQKIENGVDSFFVDVNGRSVDIIVAVHQGRKYLKTQSDGYVPNNLLDLPDCANCRLIG